MLLKIDLYRPDLKETVKSVYFEGGEKENFKKTFQAEDKKKEVDPPKDLGEKFVKILLVTLHFIIYFRMNTRESVKCLQRIQKFSWISGK
jgi:hypothetical protein